MKGRVVLEIILVALVLVGALNLTAAVATGGLLASGKATSGAAQTDRDASAPPAEGLASGGRFGGAQGRALPFTTALALAALFGLIVLDYPQVSVGPAAREALDRIGVATSARSENHYLARIVDRVYFALKIDAAECRRIAEKELGAPKDAFRPAKDADLHELSLDAVGLPQSLFLRKAYDRTRGSLEIAGPEGMQVFRDAVRLIVLDETGGRLWCRISPKNIPAPDDVIAAEGEGAPAPAMDAPVLKELRRELKDRSRKTRAGLLIFAAGLLTFALAPLWGRLFGPIVEFIVLSCARGPKAYLSDGLRIVSLAGDLSNGKRLSDAWLVVYPLLQFFFAFLLPFLLLTMVIKKTVAKERKWWLFWK